MRYMLTPEVGYRQRGVECCDGSRQSGSEGIGRKKGRVEYRRQEYSIESRKGHAQR